MIERRPTGTLLPALWQEWCVQFRGAPLAGKQALGLLIFARPAAPVAWNWRDVLRAVLWVVGLTLGGSVGFLILRILVSLGFFIGEGLRVIPSGTFDRLAAGLAPYSAALMALLMGGLLYGSMLFGIYRGAIRTYALPWSTLGFRHAGWRTYGRVAALFLPVVLGGLIVTRLERIILGGSVHGDQASTLTRGMPALPLNFLMLFLLLGVITPVVEEIFFRGFLYRLLRKQLPVWGAASVSALAFAALHGNLALIPWLFYMGVVFALVAEHTRSLWCSILLHAMTNCLATLSIVAVLSNW